MQRYHNTASATVFTASSCRTLDSAAGSLHVSKTSPAPTGSKKTGRGREGDCGGQQHPLARCRAGTQPALAPGPHHPHGSDALLREGRSRPRLLCSSCPCAEKLQCLIVAFFLFCACLSAGLLSPSPADVRVDYKAVQMEKQPRNETNNLVNCFPYKNPNSG